MITDFIKNSNVIYYTSTYTQCPMAMALTTMGQENSGCSVQTFPGPGNLFIGDACFPLTVPSHHGSKTSPILECMLPTKTNQGFSKPFQPWLGSQANLNF